MPATPGTMSETPRRDAASGIDLLTEALRAVRLNGAVFLKGCFTEPFDVIDPRSYEQRTPMARLRHVTILHLVVEGQCELETAGQTRTVSGGDLIFLPLPNSYRFRRGTADKIVNASDTVRPGTIDGLWLADHGGGGAPLHIVCGFIESAEFLFTPVFRGLPSLIVERTTEDKVGALIASTVSEIVGLATAGAPGSQLVLGRLMELLFIELLRRHVARLPDGATGWFAALRDPIVRRALQHLHEKPAQEWTVETLAQQIATSRTVLADRFNAILGRPPIDYLIAWRMQLAAEQLRTTQDALARIAASVGYESESAFSRAFKRVTGQSPGQWREMN